MVLAVVVVDVVKVRPGLRVRVRVRGRGTAVTFERVVEFGTHDIRNAFPPSS